MSEAVELQAGLRAVLGTDDVTLPRRLGGGSSQENWAFETGGADPRDLLLRRDPASGVVDTPRDVEYALLAALGNTGLPVAAVVAVDDGARFTRPAMIVDRLRGKAHRALLRDKDPLGLGRDGRLSMARRLAALLGEVHRLDPQELGLQHILPPPGADPARSELERWTAELDRVELEPQPVLRAVAQWLVDHAPEPVSRTHLVHGDFRPANVLVDAGEVTALLDWELAHLGDPHDDLGWYTCSLYRREHFVEGVWELPDFLAAWSAASGIEVEAGRLHFWQVMSIFRLAVIALTGVRHFVDGTTDRPAAPASAVISAALDETGLLR